MDLKKYNQLVANLKNDIALGKVEAMKLLGDIYYQGINKNEQNIKTALPYWRMAADRGDASVAGKVGLALLMGTGGVQKDEKNGIIYMGMAANEANDVLCQYLIGTFYELGEYLRKNHKEAIKYYRMAALQNHGEAQFRLGRLQMITQDRSNEWLHWICCSYLNNNKDAKDFIDYLIRKDGKKAMNLIHYEINNIKKYGIKT